MYIANYIEITYHHEIWDKFSLKYLKVVHKNIQDDTLLEINDFSHFLCLVSIFAVRCSLEDKHVCLGLKKQFNDLPLLPKRVQSKGPTFLYAYVVH